MTTTAHAAYRARFVDDTVRTATPARLLTMLYDRLVLDLARAEQAQRAGDREGASAQLLHAQDIVLELRACLRHDVWAAAAQLDALYAYLHTEMVRANAACDPQLTAACRQLVEPLRDAWHEAARTVSAGA